MSTVDVLDRAREVVSSVVDPEIPVLTIEELGILREVTVENGQVQVVITPTYSGCPALLRIEDDIKAALRREGISQAKVRTAHSPAWTTGWMSDEARVKLEEFGVAPPTASDEVLCPRCQEGGPRMVSSFGSTACKALMVCSSCGEPFDYFKEF